MRRVLRALLACVVACVAASLWAMPVLAATITNVSPQPVVAGTQLTVDATGFEFGQQVLLSLDYTTQLGPFNADPPIATSTPPR